MLDLYGRIVSKSEQNSNFNLRANLVLFAFELTVDLAQSLLGLVSDISQFLVVSQKE